MLYENINTNVCDAVLQNNEHCLSQRDLEREMMICVQDIQPMLLPSPQEIILPSFKQNVPGFLLYKEEPLNTPKKSVPQTR